MDGPHDVAGGERPGHGLVRRGGDERASLRGGRGAVSRPLRVAACGRPRLLGERVVLEHAAGGLRRRRPGHDLCDAGGLGRRVDFPSRRVIRPR